MSWQDNFADRSEAITSNVDVSVAKIVLHRTDALNECICIEEKSSTYADVTRITRFFFFFRRHATEASFFFFHIIEIDYTSFIVS